MYMYFIIYYNYIYYIIFYIIVFYIFISKADNTCYNIQIVILFLNNCYICF